METFPQFATRAEKAMALVECAPVPVLIHPTQADSERVLGLLESEKESPCNSTRF